MSNDPQKWRIARNGLLNLVLVFVLLVGGCAALLVKVGDDVNRSAPQEVDDPAPTVEEGNAFTHEGYAVDAGWKVRDDGGDVTITNLWVTALESGPFREGAWTVALTFRFYDGGGAYLAEVTCSGDGLLTGEPSSMDCDSADTMPKRYRTIEVRVDSAWARVSAGA